MSLTAVLLLLLSAMTHAGWNLLGKRNYPTAASFLIANIVGILTLSPFLAIYRNAIGFFSLRVWCLVLIAGLWQAIYCSSLASAYRAGDMSIAYPLARSSPVIVVTIVSLVLGRGDQMSWQCIYGMLLVVVGAFILPMKQFNDFSLKNYLNMTCLFALLAAIGTSGYSLADDEALRLLREAPDLLLHSWEVTLVYLFFEGVMTIFWLTIFVLGRKRGRQTLGQTLHAGLRPAIAMGVGIYLTYSLVLISMAFVPNVSYVVAFRQISIPLGVILSVVILQEAAYLPKFVGVTVMFVGLVLVGMG